eukprot:TRINITY_DN7121_c0_g2_i1.p2 TRINITY_DN7121_c0_g2~~TRINITY_DN7121_c0_g2_i1.p2  ORF type:complete len:163 (+),score=53.34 TRINITY_DN7121_c0_g2_i1:116-604(+)
MADLWAGRSELQEVAPRVYLTNYFAARKREKLAAQAITHVLVCAAEPMPLCFESDPALTYLRVAMEDNPGFPIAPAIAEGLAFVNAALRDPDARVMMHCAAGGSRSAVVALAHVVAAAQAPEAPPEAAALRTVDAALAHLQHVRPVVNPNFGFMEQLRKLYP